MTQFFYLLGEVGFSDIIIVAQWFLCDVYSI